MVLFPYYWGNSAMQTSQPWHVSAGSPDNRTSSASNANIAAPAAAAAPERRTILEVESNTPEAQAQLAAPIQTQITSQQSRRRIPTTVRSILSRYSTASICAYMTWFVYVVVAILLLDCVTSLQPVVTHDCPQRKDGKTYKRYMCKRDTFCIIVLFSLSIGMIVDVLRRLAFSNNQRFWKRCLEWSVALGPLLMVVTVLGFFSALSSSIGCFGDCTETVE